MAQNFAELCTLLVDDLYGELSSRVFSTLLRHGRLTLAGLAQTSGLTSRQLKHGLVVLIQQHLALYYSSDSDGQTYYEADGINAYMLVRSGKIIRLLQERFGESAGGLGLNLLLLGHVKIKDLADAYGFNKRKGKTNGPEGINGGGIHDEEIDTSHIRSLAELHRVLDELLRAGFVVKVQETHFRPAADIENDAVQAVMESQFPNGVKGTKEKAQLATSVKALKRKWRDGDDYDEYNQSAGTNGVSNGLKRPAPGPAPTGRKRLKLNGAALNGLNGINREDESGSSLDEEMVVRLNYEKCVVAMRSQQLVRLAERHIGYETSRVYEALLRVLERKIRRCHDDLRDYVDEEDDDVAMSPTISSVEVLNALDPDTNLYGDLILDDVSVAGANGGSGIKDDEEEEGVHEVDGDNEEPGRLFLVTRHIRLLCEDPHRFATWVGRRGGGEFRVNFSELTKSLIQHEIEQTVAAKFGRFAVRLIRILYAKGKLDEKQLHLTGMIKQKEVRAVMSTMQEEGFAEIQEVPRDNNKRDTSRAIFLWFFEQDRVRRLLLAEAYKAMSRILQRIRVERDKVQSVIDKAERTDVVGNEDKYLNAAEKLALKEWMAVEERLLVQLDRHDELVATLRDFSPSYSGMVP
ncbi:RNA polymerase III subunit RPC82-domain-containing protein [Lineolata rhizophorae]|uniref:DNA-directed RNA polymerase III subunit RPC3 n=1 Tax=Lineolata rhizophorae TaxID=578093 RepID=A0A6A6NS68_9PEZI|nr:RNA polymerase III subunit RPC82-domain-containing protein [Lineolata rhizophorae]